MVEYLCAMLQSLISFTVLAWLLTMLPGIDTAQVLRAVAVGGKRQAYATLFGIMSGVWVWGVGAALGISALLVASKTAYLVLKIVGAAYLVYLGRSFCCEITAKWRLKSLNVSLPLFELP